VSGQPDRSNTDKPPNSDSVPQKPKSAVPCPLLLCRGRCIRGIYCDFSHSNLERNSKEPEILSKPKHLISCPFLERKGSCLKGPKCDFFFTKPTIFNRVISQSIRKPDFFRTAAKYQVELKQVELGLQRFDVVGTRFQQTPTPMNLNHCPPMAMLQNRQQL
jgi:hypothetical protein